MAGSAVIGKPDPEKGEVPIAFVKVTPAYEGKISAPEITKWCRKNMATYKVPVIRIIKEFPLTATGKIKKEELRKELE